MANPTSVIDFSIPLSTWLASAVSDGTWSNVAQDLKVDEPGQAAPATAISTAAGQLWANMVDDFILNVYGINQGAKSYETTTTDAAPVTLATLATLSSDGDAYVIRVEAQAKTDAAAGGEVLDAAVAGVYYRTGGVVLVLNPTATVSRVGLTTAAPALVVVGDDVTLTATGELATNIKWTARAVEVREIPAP